MLKKLNVKSSERKGLRWLVLGLFGMLLVPTQAQDLLNYPLDTINGEEVYKYRVERSIGLYRIGVNFNVSQNDIIRLNPQLKERGLHFDELLYIPTGRAVNKAKKEVLIPKEEMPKPKEEMPVLKEQIPEPKKENRQPDPVVAQPSVPVEEPQPVQSIQEEEPISIVPEIEQVEPIVLDSIIDGRRVVEYALLLPFESQQTKRSVNAMRMMEFYQGALLALHDLQNDSTVYRLRVYDVERSDRRIKALCDSTELDRVHGVLGLVYPVQIEPMAKWCDAHQVPLLLPFSDNINLTKHPQAMQFNSTDKQEADSLCQWIAEQGDSLIHCVAIDVREADLSNPTRALRKRMEEMGLPFTLLPMRDLMNDSAAYALDPEKENLIIVHSDRYQHARVLMPHLTQLQEAGFRLRLVGQYPWQKENIPLPQVYTSVFTSDFARDEYELLWSLLYVNERTGDVPRYDLLGYDLIRAMIEKEHGANEYYGLQSIIRWIQDGEGGWQNAEVRVITSE